MRGEGEAALYVADEDHAKLRRVALTPVLSTSTKPGDAPSTTAEETSLSLPGRPAQVISLGDRLLVTVRDPGLLLVVRAGPQMEEIGRVALPADAWGLAVSPDGRSAYVSSAWSQQVSRIDLGGGDTPKLAWSLPTAREPRGVTVTADGKHVYVSHLVGAKITRLDVEGTPAAKPVDLPAATMSTFTNDPAHAALGYAAVLSPDSSLLFVARHAAGALFSWQGTHTVDVLVTKNDEPLAPPRKGRPLGQLTVEDLGVGDPNGPAAAGDRTEWTQPRAMIHRRKTNMLLVASEGHAVLAELDASSIAPALVTNRLYRLGGLVTERLPAIKFPPRCGAPSGIALSDDEEIAWVYCRTTDNIVAVRLTPDGERAHPKEISFLKGGAFHDQLSEWGPFAYASLDVPKTDEMLGLGRRLYFDATDIIMSGDMACAGCHPDGRDDGHVWRERPTSVGGKVKRFLAGPSLSQEWDQTTPQRFGVARQTPMLAGRLKSENHYGWQAESTTLVDRLKAGFMLHRGTSGWNGEDGNADGQTQRIRIDPLIRFLREGLVEPPKNTAPFTPEETKGQQIFLSAESKCATCHVPADGEYTNRQAVLMRGYPTARLFTVEENAPFKTPSLRHVAGTPPYFHDGSAASLDELVEKNADRMGKTSHLDAEGKKALVAFLKRL